MVGKTNGSSTNATKSPMMLREFDETDSWEWIQEGSFTLDAGGWEGDFLVQKTPSLAFVALSLHISHHY